MANKLRELVGVLN